MTRRPASGTRSPGRVSGGPLTGSPLRQATELSVRACLLAADTSAAFLESAGRVSGVPFLERAGAAQARLVRSVAEATAAEARRFLAG